MAYSSWVFVIFFWVFSISGTHQLLTSQTQVLLQIRKHLEYPSALEIWGNYSGDYCYLAPTPHMSIKCEANSVTELKVMGDKLPKVSEFIGYAIPTQTLSGTFSIHSFVTTLTRLPSLKVVSLVSMGIWGPLPDKIHRLSSLELLDMSSNFMYGSIPPQLSRLVKLQSLSLDSNFFNDTVPNWFDSLTNLTVLSLKNNQLKGQFPSSICRIKTLTNFALAHNNLSGKLPELSGLRSLHVLDLRENQFDSELPLLPNEVTTVLLSKNNFSGKIPEEFGKLDKLQHLDISFSSLSGTPPSSLFSLPNISYLNLASNQLNGSLPSLLHCGGELGFVDISSNRLTGAIPSCLSSLLNGKVVKLGGNCLSIDVQHQYPDSYCQETHKESKRSKRKEEWVLICIIVGAIFMLLLAVGLLVFYRRYYTRGVLEQQTAPKVMQDASPAEISSELLANARLISQAAKLGTQGGAPVYRQFTLEELVDATENFSKTMFLGEGSLGQVPLELVFSQHEHLQQYEVYKGKLENGSYVAIRSLALSRKYSVQNLKLRLDLLSKLRHPHLVAILGHCIDCVGQDDTSVSRLFLVYEYIPNSDFRSHLSENLPGKVLTWSERLAVLIGIAKAVHFLHTGVISASFSNGLKTNNILLDEHGIAKLSDYGMSLITEDYEKQEGKGDRKSLKTIKLEDDVYKFGFILLESLVGPVITGKGEAFLLNEMTSFSSHDGRRRIVDPVVLTTSTQESLSTVISITNKCISPELSTRPSFEDVLWNLQYASQVQATADSDQKSDATSQSSSFLN